MTERHSNAGSPANANGQGEKLARPLVAETATAELGLRLKAIIGDESVASFARRCGIAESVLRTYLRDGRMPPLDRALAISAAAAVSVDWLATGRGARALAQTPAAYSPGGEDAAVASRAPAIDVAVLEGIVKAVLLGQGAQAPVGQLAAMIVDLYQRAVDRGAS